MNKPHKHAELIKQWADGAEIEELGELTNAWYNCPHPSWGGDITYRIKPQPVECWANYYTQEGLKKAQMGGAYASEEEALGWADGNIPHRTVHMREVTDK
jgi:hypothetical protein